MGSATRRDDASEMSDDEVKEEDINIKVRDMDGTEVHFKVRPTTKFSKVFEAYCQRKTLQMNAVRFLVDGERVRAEQMPQDLDMEDGDCVDAMMEQVGGR